MAFRAVFARGVNETYRALPDRGYTRMCCAALAILCGPHHTTRVSPDVAAPEPLDQKTFVAKLSRQLIGKAAEIRHALIDLAAQAEHAPIGSCLSIVDVLCALYYQYLDLDTDTPGAPSRGRVVFSKAHALLVVQPLLAELGLLPEAAYGSLATDHCRAPGVPDLGTGPGLDAAPALPGIGLGLAAGRALAAQLAGASWRVYCVLGDGECSDGAVWEAAQFAAHYQLGNLVVVLDRNALTADGPTMQVLDPEPLAGKWFNAGWDVFEIDGHAMEHVVWALETLPPPTEPKPIALLCRTTSGAGVDFMEDKVEWCRGALSPDLAAQAHASIDRFAAAKLGEVRG